jgi:hypothetical protein
MAAEVAFSASACFSALVAAKALPATSDSDNALMPRILDNFMVPLLWMCARARWLISFRRFAANGPPAPAAAEFLNTDGQ